MHNSLTTFMAALLFSTLYVTAADSGQDEQATLPLELDLPTAIRMADQNNPVLRRSRERINESESALKVTKSSLYPDVNLFGSYQGEQQERVGSFGGGTEPDDTFWSTGVELTQPLFSGGKLIAASTAREYELQGVEQDVVTTRARVFSEVYRKFYDALLAREVLKVQQDSLDLITQQLQIASNRFAAGAGPKFDVLQAQVRVANARPPLIRAANNYRTSVDALRTTIGVIYPEGMGPTNITLKGEWVNLTLSSDLNEAIAVAVENRPELLATMKNRDAAEENVKRYKAERMPSIDFVANYAVENDRFSPGNDTLEGWRVGVVANLSLWEGGRVSGEIARYQSIFDQLSAQVEAERLEIELQVRSAWNSTEEAREILASTEFVIAQAEEALRMAQNRYSAGALTQLDVLSSELAFTQARLEKLTAARNFNIAVIDFNRAIGKVPGIEYIKE